MAAGIARAPEPWPPALAPGSSPGARCLDEAFRGFRNGRAKNSHDEFRYRRQVVGASRYSRTYGVIRSRSPIRLQSAMSPREGGSLFAHA